MVKRNWCVLASLLAIGLNVGCRTPSPPPPERIEVAVPIASASVEGDLSENLTAASYLELTTAAGTIASCAIRWAEEIDEKTRRTLKQMRTMPLVIILFKPKEKVVIGTSQQAKAAEWEESPPSMPQPHRIERGELSYNPTTGMLTLWLENATPGGEEIRVARVISGLDGADVLEQLIRADGTFPEQIRAMIRLQH